MRHPRTALTSLAAMVIPMGIAAQGGKIMVTQHLESQRSYYGAIAQQIFDWAEVGYQEVRSSELLQSELRDAGFTVEAGVAGIPTAFVASYGRGGPVIGILAEYDALPGITQEVVPVVTRRLDASAGHACGHHLFGTASTGAAIAVKQWLAASGTSGTIRLYGTPAEEGGAGKVYMVRAGLFDDVDVVLNWHAGDRNQASPSTSLSNKSAKFRFTGVSAHAAAAPERGRSALDGVEAMNHMVNLMREHVPQETRIHYVITSGGSAPNVVPDFAEVYYYVRHPESAEVQRLFERVVEAAEGAALGTGTQVEYEVIHGIHALLPNDAVQRAMYQNLVAVGGVSYTPEEREFAETLSQSLPEDALSLESAMEVQPYEFTRSGGSTDVADVSWMVPTAGLRTATWVPGTAAHSWQAIAAGGMSIGEKGMINAAKVMAMTAVDLITRPDLVAEAKAEYRQRVGPNFVYQSLVGDRDPPLDYRRPAGGNR